MIHTSITNFRKNIFKMLEQTIKFNEQINISTKNGNVVIISEQNYNGLLETLHLSSNPTMQEKIVDGLRAPSEDCLPENEVYW